MLFQKVLNDHDAATRYMERYINKRKPGAHSQWSDVREKYTPEGGAESFLLPEYSLPLDRIRVVRAFPSPEVEQQVLRQGIVYFPVHPDMLGAPGYLSTVGLQEFPRSDRRIRVTPTSSTRTLWTLNRFPNYMIKTDLDKRHYRFNRRLKRSSVLHSISVSQALEAASATLLADGIAFLPESIGIVLGEEDDSSAGAIFRETIPRPYCESRRLMVPLFSLYGQDERNLTDPSLLHQLVAANAPKNAETDWFVNELLGRIVRTWTQLVLRQGILHEIHGQNALLELDQNMQPQRIVIRDLQGVYIDEAIRCSLGLDVFSRKHLAGAEPGTTRHSQFSHSYDHMVGDYLLSRLTDAFLAIYPDAKRREIIDGTRAIFRTSFPDYQHFFPKESYGFGPQGNNNEVALVVKYPTPTWR